MTARWQLSLLLALLLAPGCAAPTPTPAPAASATGTSTITPSRTASPSPTAEVPTPTATPQTFPGTLTTLVNLRSGPGTGFENLGQLAAGEVVQVLFRSPDGAWYRVLPPGEAAGAAWVASAYVTLPQGVEVPLEATPAPTGPSGTVVQRLNVRLGPGTAYESLGLLEAGEVVPLLAKNATGSWFLVVYPPGGEERGWVSAQYIRTDSASTLPVVDESGQPVLTGTPGPTEIPMTPTPTTGPAFADDDSRSQPAVDVTFSYSGTRHLTYSSQLSSPSGDGEDWVRFSPFALLPGEDARLLFSLACTGTAGVEVSLWQGETPLEGWGALSCGDAGVEVRLAPGIPSTLRLEAAAGADLRLVFFTLTVENLP